MSSKTLCNLVRVAVIAVAVCGFAVCGYIFPVWGAAISEANPEFAHCYLPWLLFLWGVSLPCFIVLALVWKVSTSIRREQVFTLQTAKLVKSAAMLILVSVSLFFTGNVVFALLNMSHPGILLLSIFTDVFGISLAVLAAVLSRYLTKAAVLQEEADGTV
jgi:hypothetical protein